MKTGRTRPTLAVATRQSPSRDFTLQKYIQLSGQRDNVQNRLALTTSPSSTTTSPVSAMSPTDPFALSPTNSNTSSMQPTNYHTSMSNYLSTSQPTEAMPRARPVSMVLYNQLDEERLADINHQIKATLTELLNHESVRRDDRFRHWVQERLMEAELETKRQRRRSRRRSSVDHEAVNSIAEHIRNPEVFRFGTTL